jgi:hypothetical protein
MNEKDDQRRYARRDRELRRRYAPKEPRSVAWSRITLLTLSAAIALLVLYVLFMLTGR